MIEANQKKDKKKVPILIKILQFLLYLPIQILFVPLIIISLFDGIIREFVVGKRMGVSYSAGQTLQYRVFMHHLGVRHDPQTIAFTKAFPCQSEFCLWAIFGAISLSHRWFGYTTKLSRLAEEGMESHEETAGARVAHFDEVLKKYVDQVDQVVLPGVGFDLIALHFTKGKKVKVFEIDQTNSIKVKVDTLEKANLEHDWITYIPVDYNRESWLEKLEKAGFDRSKKTLFLWQSVSHFLDEATVKNSIRQMAELSAAGSIIVQDFYSENFIHHDNSLSVKKQKKMMAQRGEPWIFGVDMSMNPKESVEAFLHDCGLELSDYRQFGEKLDIEPFYCIVESRL